MKRVYHRYEKCEEFKSPMWRACKPQDSQLLILGAAKLMIDHQKFKDACMKVVNEWPVSCEANLTAHSINHQAWIGHAACAIELGSPEDMTRFGWRTLTKEQQDLANAAADDAIAYWSEKYIGGENA